MAKRGGFPGGMGMPGNMNNLMKQAQRMQRQMCIRDSSGTDAYEGIFENCVSEPCR